MKKNEKKRDMKGKEKERKRKRKKGRGKEKKNEGKKKERKKGMKDGGYPSRCMIKTAVGTGQNGQGIPFHRETETSLSHRI